MGEWFYCLILSLLVVGASAPIAEETSSILNSGRFPASEDIAIENSRPHSPSISAASAEDLAKFGLNEDGTPMASSNRTANSPRITTKPVVNSQESPESMGDDGDGSSETVGGTSTAAFTPPSLPEILKKPTAIKDCATCAFGSCNGDPKNFKGHPWGQMTLMDRIETTVKNVQEVNQSHGYNIDPRIMLCIAKRESGINPTAKTCISGSSAAGMFQVVATTAKVTMQNHSSKIPGFRGLSGVAYHQKMAESTVAQAELSMLTLIDKAKNPTINKESQLVNGTGSISDYAPIVQAYYGIYNPGTKNYFDGINYRRGFERCYSCLTQTMDSSGRAAGSVESCLKRATR